MDAPLTQIGISSNFILGGGGVRGLENCHSYDAGSKKRSNTEGAGSGLEMVRFHYFWTAPMLSKT